VTAQNAAPSTKRIARLRVSTAFFLQRLPPQPRRRREHAHFAHFARHPLGANSSDDRTSASAGTEFLSSSAPFPAPDRLERRAAQRILSLRIVRECAIAFSARSHKQSLVEIRAQLKQLAQCCDRQHWRSRFAGESAMPRSIEGSLSRGTFERDQQEPRANTRAHCPIVIDLVFESGKPATRCCPARRH